MTHRLPAKIILLLCGIAIGVSLAYGLAHRIQLQEGRAALRDYANRLVKIGDQLGEEDSQAIAAVLNDNLPFCSDQELAFMRDYVFRAQHIRDLGRTRGGKLICSTGIGRLARPKPQPVPDISTGNLKIYIRAPLMISAKTKGFIVEQNGVSLVLNSDAIDNYNEPPKFYSAFLYDQMNHHITHTYGPTVPLSMDDILAGKMSEHNGIFYQPVCSQTSMVCQVAIESRRDMPVKTGSLVIMFLVGGALLGGAAAIILILFYEQQRSLELQLRRAVRRDELTLVYQPVVNLETLAVVGAEALVRWVNGAGESVRPDTFIALAEDRGFVGEITQFVLRKATDEIGDLLAAGNFRLTVNITAEDLHNPAFITLLAKSLSSAKLAPSTIGLELTERSTADHKLAMHAISELQTAGHTVYIDDFGTGYSSLAYLHRLSADAIKIDRAFTQTVGTGAVTASVVPQILNMAEQLELMVVVEGIETAEQAEYFRNAGVGILGQGWLFGRPMSAAQLKSLARAGVHHVLTDALLKSQSH